MKALFAILLSLPAWAFGDEPCPCPIPPAGPPPPWSGKAELAFVSTSGNTSVQTLGTSLEVNYKPLPWSFQAKGAYLSSESDGVTTARSTAALLRGGRLLTDRLEVYIEGDYYKNTFSGIESRYSGEGGAAYAVLPGPTHTLKLGLAIGYLHENRIGSPDQSFAMARPGLDYSWKFTDKGEFKETFFYTADLQDSGDWRIGNATSLTAQFTKVLALRVSWVLTYLNQPVPGFKHTDTVTTAGVLASF
jgi:putative salt-induced outer membrane protein